METGLVLEKPRTLLHLDLLPPGAGGIVGLAHREFFLKKILFDEMHKIII